MMISRASAAVSLDVSSHEPEISTGYKRTELGKIPDDWTVVRLGDVVTFLDGQRRPVKDADRAKMRGSIPYYGASGIVDYVNDCLFDEELILLGEDGENILSRRTRLALRISGKAWVNNHAHVLRPHPNISIGFLADYLESLDYKRFNSGTAQPKLNKQTCIGIALAIPPTKAEQEAIAEALTDADDLIESLEQLIAKKRAVKQGAMQDLLTGEQRLPGFSKQWGVTTLEDCSAFITKGSTPTTYGFNWEKSGVLFLRSECVSPHGLDLSESMFISDLAHSMLRRSEVAGGDILMTITGNVGRVIQLPADFGLANINQHIARIRIISPAMRSNFVTHVLKQEAYRKHYASILTGQAYPQISLKQVRETTVPAPELEEQIAIAATLSDMDAEVDALQSKLTKARQIKQGMMQELLTGRVRLL